MYFILSFGLLVCSEYVSCDPLPAYLNILFSIRLILCQRCLGFLDPSYVHKTAGDAVLDFLSDM